MPFVLLLNSFFFSQVLSVEKEKGRSNPTTLSAVSFIPSPRRHSFSVMAVDIKETCSDGRIFNNVSKASLLVVCVVNYGSCSLIIPGDF